MVPLSVLRRPAHALANMIREGEISSEALTAAYLERIEALDANLGAFRVVTAERALAQARAADQLRASGAATGPLHGVPYAAKDLFDVRGEATTAGCTLLEDAHANDDATVIGRLSDHGMVLLGKTNTVQFAYGGAGINHHHGTPHNPWHRVPHLPGGSSSGSGVAVAAAMAPVALGTDTGGSVRIPAALCGISGLKTTVGRISRHGVYPLSQSLDSVGPLGHDVRDCALLLEAMQGYDPKDSSTACVRAGDFSQALDGDIDGLRIAFAETVFYDQVSPEVASAVDATAGIFEASGANVRRIAFPPAQRALELNPRALVIAAEAYRNNRRLVDEHFDALDPIVASRLLVGREILAADYLEIVDAWHALRAETTELLEDIDVLLCPTTQFAAMPVAEADATPDSYAFANIACLRNTAVGNILNLTGLSVPCGRTGAGLPIGLMIYAKSFDERSVLRVGHAFQQATDWHLQYPALDWLE